MFVILGDCCQAVAKGLSASLVDGRELSPAGVTLEATVSRALLTRAAVLPVPSDPGLSLGASATPTRGLAAHSAPDTAEAPPSEAASPAQALTASCNASCTLEIIVASPEDAEAAAPGVADSGGNRSAELKSFNMTCTGCGDRALSWNVTDWLAKLLPRDQPSSMKGEGTLSGTMR
jgi:hypothetical protein